MGGTSLNEKKLLKNSISGQGMEIKWIVLAIVSHTAWGGYPVLARYLQKIHHISTMSLSAMTNLLAVAVLFLLFFPHIDMKAISWKDWFFFSLIVIARNLLNLYAARLTYANNIQLFSLLAPFLVAFFSKTIFKEVLPRHTGTALLFCLLGAVFMIFGSSKGNIVAGAQNASNWLGIVLAIAGGVLLAMLMLAIKYVGKKGANAETMAFVQFGVLSIFMLTGSITVKEDWTPWFSLPLSGIIVCLAYSLIILLLGTILQNNSIKKLGAATYTTIQAWRLISTIAFSWIFMGEGIETIWQGLGALIVMAVVTLYMLSQKRERTNR